MDDVETDLASICQMINNLEFAADQNRQMVQRLALENDGSAFWKLHQP